MTPYAIFKGKSAGMIQREYSSRQSAYPTSMKYSVQENSWMDSSLVLVWIIRYDFSVLNYRVFDQFIQTVGNSHLWLVLDSLSAHRTAAVVSALATRQIQTVYIPGSLTGDLQPLYLGINSPFKHWLREG